MTAKATPRRTEYMRVRDLPEADRNAKSHDDGLIGESISRFGFVENIVIDERTGKIIAGHGRRARLLASEQAGEKPPDGIDVRADGWYAPVTRGWASKDDAEADAAGIALNRVGEKGGWDNDALYDILSDQTDLTGLGWSSDDLTGLVADTGTGGDDVTPAPPLTERFGVPPFTGRTPLRHLWT